MTSGLESLQLALQHDILAERGGAASYLRRSHGVDSAARLAIYRHAYRARLVDALRENFGHTAQYLGEDAFDEVARAYLEDQPSRHANLRWFGASFPAWLSRDPARRAECPGIAALDWALRCAFDGPDEIPLGLEDLARITPAQWPAARFGLHPTCSRPRLEHNAVEIWHALDAGAPPPSAVRLAREQAVLVWRRALEPHFRTLGDEEAMALELVARGTPFAEVCAQLAAIRGEDGADREIGTLLRRWIDDGLLVAPPVYSLGLSPVPRW